MLDSCLQPQSNCKLLLCTATVLRCRGCVIVWAARAYRSKGFLNSVSSSFRSAYFMSSFVAKSTMPIVRSRLSRITCTTTLGLLATCQK